MRSAIFLVVLLLSSWVLQAQDEASIQALLSEADVLISRNNLPEALTKTQQALAVSPGYHPALQKQINIYFLMNDDKEALRLAGESIQKYPGQPEYYYLRGIIHNAMGKYGKALNDFDQSISLNPGEMLYRSYLGRGVSHLNLLEYEQALADFSTSIEHNDTVASAYHSRALVNYELHDYSAAVNDFLKVLGFSQGNSSLYFNLGMSYFRLSEKDKACPYFNKSCSMGNMNACKMTLMECAKTLPVIP